MKSILSLMLSLFIIFQPNYLSQIDDYKSDSSSNTYLIECLSGFESETDEITAVIQFEYELNNISDFQNAFTNNLENNETVKNSLRDSNKNYYSNMNQIYMEALNISYSDIEISAYSPFIFVKFTNANEYYTERDNIVDLSKRIGVKNIFVSKSPETLSSSAVKNGFESEVSLDFSDAKGMMSITNNNYTGDGIKIGFIETGYATESYVFNNSTYRNFENGQIKGIRNSTNIDNGDIAHATSVASIAGGDNGIAPDAELYFAGIFSVTGVEWLLDQSVDIINMSSFILFHGVEYENDFNNGKYSGFDAYIDFIVWNNAVTFIHAAGNSDQDEYVNHPGLGLNVITVGSIDGNKCISYSSSYDVNSSCANSLMKPTVVAPGENIVLPEMPIPESGTSFSAPMVTGIVALLMERFPILTRYPELTMSAIINGAERLPTQTNIWDEYAGAGLINYTNSANIIANLLYSTSTVSASTLTNADTLITLTTTVDYGDTLRCTLVSSCDSDIRASDVTEDDGIYGYAPRIPIVTKYTVKIFNSSGNLIQTFSSNSNIVIGEYKNLSGTQQTYTIKVFLDGVKQSSSYEILGLTYRILP